MLKRNLLSAPILAVTLAILLAGSVSFLPQGQTEPQTTPAPSSSTTQQPATMAVSPFNSVTVSVLFAVAAIAIGAVTAYLYFSEKTLKKEISK